MSSAGRPSVSTIGGRFKKLGKIGEGSFGDVFKALDTETNEVVAVKVINLEEAEEEIEEIREEITMLSECQSPYVTRYITSYTNGPELCIAMEYLGGGSVHDLLDDGPLDESYVGIITRELLKACDYLHSNGKIHRDIKAANILLSSKGDVKLSDFGVTAKLTNTIQKRNTFVGTPFWMAPEVIKQSDYNQSADIWSIGITVIEMFVGHPPFHDVHPMKALFLIPKADPPSLETHPTASKALKEFVALCCQKDATKRPTVKALLSSKFVRSAKKNSALQELLMEKQMKAEASSKRNNGTSRSQGVNEDDFGDEMTVVEEEVETQDGDDSWSFTVKQPSATAAAQKAKAEAADIGTVRAASTTLQSPSHSQAVLGRPSISHVHSLAPGLPVPSPSSGTMHSGLTNTITKTTRYDSNTVRGGDLHSEDDVSSGSGSDDDGNGDDDDDDGMGTVRMVGKSSKYNDDIDMDDDVDQQKDANKNSLQNMFHRPSITGETTPPKPQPPPAQPQQPPPQPPQPSPPAAVVQPQPPIPAPVPIPSSLPPPAPVAVAAVAPSSSKNTPLHSASNSPASSAPTTPVLAARSVPPPVKSATFHPGSSNHSNNNNTSMTNFTSAVARAATLFNSMHSNTFPAVATATQTVVADLDALESIRAGLGAEFLRFCVASLDAGVSRPASPSIKPVVPPKPLFNLNTSSPSSSPAASPVLQSNSNTPIVPPTPLTAVTTPSAVSAASSPAPMARRDSKPPMSAFYQQSPQQQTPAASPAATAVPTPSTSSATAAAASPAASPAAALLAVNRQNSLPSSSASAAATSTPHPPVVASGSATVGPAATKSSIFSNARSMWQQKEEQAKQQQQVAGAKVVPPHLRNMSK